MAASALLSLSDKKLTELKNRVIRILKSCDGQCLELQRFKAVYENTFGQKFDVRYSNLKSKKLKTVMEALNDVILLEQSGYDITMKLKHQASLDLKSQVNVKSGSSTVVRSQGATQDSQLMPNTEKSLFSPEVLPSKGVSEKSRSLEIETPEDNIVRVNTPQQPALSPGFGPAPTCSNLLPLLSTPMQLKGTECGSQVSLPASLGASGVTTQPIPSMREIMEQQEREGNSSSKVLPLREMGTPNKVKRTPINSSPQLSIARIRELGTPGPFEKSIHHAQQIMNAGTSKAKTSNRNCSLQDVNRAAEDIIVSLSEKGKFVCLEEVKARLCKEFGKSNFSTFGFKKDKDVPALYDLIQLQAKVSLFVHAYVMTNSICTLHELGQSLADLESKSDFEELKLGPLLQQPVVYDMFKTPSNLPSPRHITTIQILKHLEKYMTQEDLWRTKVNLKYFLEYLCEQHDCDSPYELGVRIQSVGLAISVIKKAKHSDSERWKAIRAQVEVDMDEEINRYMRKIKKDLLGQDLGDLRSCVMKFLDTSAVSALSEIFECSLQLFQGKSQKKISDFLSLITGDSIGRNLFQLALFMSCKNLLGDALEHLVAYEIKNNAANAVNERLKLETRPVPPCEVKVVDEVKQWLVKADQLDLARLALIEETVVSKFPEFKSFEELDYGSFLKFLSSHKVLQEAIEQVGGLGDSVARGTMLGRYPLSLHSVLDFVSQFGTQISHEIIERSLCTYYGVNKVTDLGFGSFLNILKKAENRQKDLPRKNTPLMVYEAPYMCQDSATTAGTKDHNSGVLGYMSKEDAIAAIRSTPLLEDVALWTHWDEVYGGDVSKLGDLKSFLENEEILINAGKSSTGSHGSVAVMESSPGVLLRVTSRTSTEVFRDFACVGDAVGAAGHLVSMVMMNGGVANTPVALLSNHVQSALAAMASHDFCCDFILQCLVRMPRRLAQAVGTKVFLEPLKKLVGSTEAPLLLLSNCSAQLQRSRLHQLGFALGISQWIEDFRKQVSYEREEESGLNIGELQAKDQKRPIAVVKPVPSSNENNQPHVAEESVPTPENTNEMTVFRNEAGIHDGDEDDAIDPDVDNLVQPQQTPLLLFTENEDKCRAVIEKIRREEFGIGLELGEEESKLVQRQREREGRGLHRLSSELYSRDTHFVLELVQNADDNSYPGNNSDTGPPSLVFVLERDRIMVLNNEVGFMENNIRALCDVGRSTKGAHRYGYIGQKGIGFKSVFRVSDCPEVHSNGYHIRFDAKSGPIGYILPQWIEEECEEEQECDDRPENTADIIRDKNDVNTATAKYTRWSTRIVLPLKEEHQGMELKTSLAARFRDVHPSLLLFLHRLRSISIQDKVNKICRDMIRKDLGDNIMEVSHSHGTDRWLVLKKQLDASHMKEEVEMTELALAFPLFDEQDAWLGRRHQKLPQQYVFAYLPLRSYGFRFIIQGDFEVPSSREDVDRDKSWNQWLREEIPQLFIDALSIFMGHSSFSGLSSVASYFQFVPLEEEILGFFTPVARQILTLIQGKPCIPVKLASLETEQPKKVENGFECVLPCEAVFSEDSTAQKVITPSILKKHLGLRYLHPDIGPALNPTLRSRLGIETLSSKHLIEIGKEEVKEFSCEGDMTKSDDRKIAWLAQWLQCMYRSLDQERNSSQEMLDTIGSLRVIPLTDGTFVNLKGDCVFLPLSMNPSDEATAMKKKRSSAKSHEQICFSVLERDLSTVHPALFSSLDDVGRTQVEQLLRRLGVKSWSARDLINSHILPTFNSDKWKTKSDEVLRSYLVYILHLRLSDPSVCDVTELRSSVQILTNKGRFNPVNTSIYFTTKFGNTIDLPGHLPSISWTLVDESYLDSCGGSKARISDWKAFLSELGVQDCLAIKKKQVKLFRSSMAQTPWASYEAVWQTTPDGVYIVDDYACQEFEEFLRKITDSNADRQSICSQSKVLAQWIDDRWDRNYSQFADGFVHVKDSNDHKVAETRSSFYLNLVLKPWMSASDGQTICLPRDLFIWSEAVDRLLENHVKYAAADLRNSGFISTLHIRENISEDGMISELKKWSTRSGESDQECQTKEFTTSLMHMSEVYSFLYDKMVQSEEQRWKVYNAFLKNALIFVPFRCPSSSFMKPQIKQQLPGTFHLIKHVCWRDPTGVALKLLRDHGKVTTRHLLEGFYHSMSKASAHQSLVPFFVDQLKVDETPYVDEYLEMASTIADAAGFPTPLAMNDMLNVFAILGRKCVARGHSDFLSPENEINEHTASRIRHSLETEFKCIFPSSGKWVSLSDKPLLPDDKSLVKIFHKESGVHLVDLGDFFQDPKQQEMKRNVSLFLKACEIKLLSECVTREFIPTLVKYQCVPLQKYCHQIIPAVQRFLYSRNQTVYEQLKNQRFAQKLLQMQFASVEKLETVYSLSTHPDVRVGIEEKSGVEPVSSSFCFYVVQEHQDNDTVLNAEMVKLLLGGKNQVSSDLSNFLVAVRNYNGIDFESFLEEVQYLESLPDGEESWCVPPPDEPDIVEVEEEVLKKVVPHSGISLPNRADDDGLHSWPPKSPAQYDKSCKREAEPRSDSALKMWPPPAPPDSVKKPLEEHVQGRPTQCVVDTGRPNDHKDTSIEPDDGMELIPQQRGPTLITEAVKKKEDRQTVRQDDPNPVKDNVSPERVSEDCLTDEKSESVCYILPVGEQSPPKPESSCNLSVPACEARQTPPARTFLCFNDETSQIDYDDLSFNEGDFKVSNDIQLGENPNKEEVGRWGEHCVYEFLRHQVKLLAPGDDVDIIWMNEKANTTAPYDFEIRRRVTGMNAGSETVITYIEVKTTSSDQKEFFEMSVPELLFALEKKEALHLYRVFNAGKSGCLRIRRLKNLASQLDRKNVKLFMAI